MKLFILSLIALIFSMESFAQYRPHRAPRGPRYNPPTHRPGPVVIRPGYSRPRPGRVIITAPRYNPNSNYRRVRTYRRAPVSWRTGFHYACGRFGELLVNGRPMHTFRYDNECSQAIRDIRQYGDFCDNEDMYNRYGRLEAQFNFSYQCRAALGYYY